MIEMDSPAFWQSDDVYSSKRCFDRPLVLKSETQHQLLIDPDRVKKARILKQDVDYVAQNIDRGISFGNMPFFLGKDLLGLPLGGQAMHDIGP